MSRTQDAAMVRCRTYGHGWDEWTPVGMRKPPWGFRLSLRCVRCGTERHDIIDANGDVSSRKYYYPDGYKMTRDERPTRPQFRLLLLKEQRREAREARREKANA
jgi:hypothetical protein